MIINNKNIGKDFEIKIYENSKNERDFNAGRQARTVIWFYNTGPAIGDTIKITSTDGTIRSYIGHANENLATGRFKAGVLFTLQEKLESFTDCIDHVQGHDGKILTTYGADALGRDIATLTQLIRGRAGDGPLPNNLSDAEVPDFSGGMISFIPFRLTSYGAASIRRQTPDKCYKVFLGEQK